MKKTRPALLINNDALGKLPLKIIVPITDWKEQYGNYPWMVKVTQTNKTAFQKYPPLTAFKYEVSLLNDLLSELALLNLKPLLKYRKPSTR
jgi:mRNA interferase MazF